MVLNYKIATLYFGSGDYQYLYRLPAEDHYMKPANSGPIFNAMRGLLHLMAHYELGNYRHHGVI